MWEDVLPAPHLATVLAEARKLSSWALEGGTLEQGKRATCWMNASHLSTVVTDGGHNNDDGVGDSVLLLEAYVRRLALLVADAHRGSNDANWLGYEYWVQRVSAKDTPAFHFDKDEALSSLSRRFVFPDVSSIFFLTYVLPPPRMHCAADLALCE